jgi:hypothetical protein
MSADDKKKPEQTAGAVPSIPTGMPDLNALRLPQDFAANLGVKKLLVQVPVTKPRKGWFVRTRPGDAWRTPVAMIGAQGGGRKLRRRSHTRCGSS